LWVLLGGGALLTVAALSRGKTPPRDVSPFTPAAPPPQTSSSSAEPEHDPFLIASAKTAYQAGKKAGESVVETVKDVVEPVVSVTYKYANSARGWLSRLKAPENIIEDIAERLGVSTRFVTALAAHESGGRGPDAFRFECHLFNAAVGSTAVPCTIGSGGVSHVDSETNYAAFKKAYAINPGAAVTASSWGAFQVRYPVELGLSPTPQAWLARWETEKDSWTLSRDLMLAWFSKWNGPKALAGIKDAEAKGGKTPEDWGTFSRYYNGKTYAANEYHQKIAAAYNVQT
jgi:hypothetical protein